MTLSKLAAAALLSTSLGTPALADEVKVGILLGFTGPIESLAPAMAQSAEMAFKEATEAGLLDGATLKPVRGDSTCVDASAATSAAERLVTSDRVVAIVGAACSGATTAVASNVTVPNGIPMISPSATSPALTTLEDDGLFFRTAPSDARQGEVMADVVKERGIDEVAVTYTNNDYGKGLADSFKGAYEKLGGKILLEAPHEDGKADYSAEVGALAASGAKDLVVLGYVDQGGRGIVQTALDQGAFERFVFGDGMVAPTLIKALGRDIQGSFGTLPGSDSESAKAFAEMASNAGIADGPYRGESYDAAALIALAMQAAGSTDGRAIANKIQSVANAPGEKIGVGEIAKGLQILKDGGEIDYVGATDVEFTDAGEAAGSYREVEVEGDSFATRKIR